MTDDLKSNEKDPLYLINLLKTCYFGREMPKAIYDEILRLRVLVNNS